MVQIAGKYVLESSENFDAFLCEIGVGFIVRNLAKTSKPEIQIEIRPDGTYVIKTVAILKTTTIEFKLGEEFQETRMDGKTVKVRLRYCCFIVSLPQLSYCPVNLRPFLYCFSSHLLVCFSFSVMKTKNKSLTFIYFDVFQTVVTLDGNTLTQIQYGDKEVKIEREFTETHMKTVSFAPFVCLIFH